MSTARLSPTAALLKNSRLFSVPPPLVKPVADLGLAPNSTSDSATLPYPTHAAIQTTDSGLARGDWGLKRPLPLKSTTKTSTPSVQFDNIDSIDHITDFKSAAAYTRTLAKWQEMGLPLTKSRQTAKIGGSSVFESYDDRTCRVSANSSKNRWRFEGPWLAQLTEEEYLNYLRHNVKNRRPHFRKFLQGAIARERHLDRRKALRDRGESEAALTESADQVEPLTEKELDDAIRMLRQTPYKIDQYVSAFLDLPRSVQGSDEGPPSTHPSAGLSYQRSRAHTLNHPLYGPQEFKYSIEARILQSQLRSRANKRGPPVLGVAGVGALEKQRVMSGKYRDSSEEMRSLDMPGGLRTIVHVERATITPNGRIRIQTDNPEPNALKTGGIPINTLEDTKQDQRPRSVPASSEMPPLVDRHSGYGLEKDLPRTERAKPLENPQQSLQSFLRQQTK